MLDKVASIIREVAAQNLLPHFQKLAAGEVTTKSGPTDFVTVADIEAERALSSRLQDLIPNSLVVGEEVAFKNPAIFDVLSCRDETIWIIDPLDGTKNFVKGKDVFGIIVSLVKNGKIVAGWINIPLHDDLMIMGEKSSGAFSGSTRLHLPLPNPSLDEMQGTFNTEQLPSLSEKLKNPLWWESAAFSYAMLLSGVVDFGIYRMHPLQPWDHAAGVFMYEEQGGYAALLDGAPYYPMPQNGTLILAPNKNVGLEISESISYYVS